MPISLPPYSRVIVALDGSPEAAEALVTAAEVSEACDASLETLSVTRTAQAAEMRTLVWEQLRTRSLEASKMVIDCESPSASHRVNMLLADDGADGESSLVVATTRGIARTAGLRGSFAENVLSESGGPLLLVGPRCRRPFATGEHRRLVVAIDDPKLDQRMVQLVASWANTFDLEVELLHVNERRIAAVAVEAAAWEEAQDAIIEEKRIARAIAGELNRPVSFKTISARTAVDGIVDHLDDPAVAAVVMASHARSALCRLAMGSVATGVTHAARCPVLMIRPDAADAAARG